MARGKCYREKLAAYERDRRYPLADAVAAIKAMPPAKFDETVELTCGLGIDPRQTDQNVRGVVALPHGSGKEVRIVVIAQGDEAQAARDAGATEVGFDDLLKRIEDGWLDFDVMIATPDAMGKVRRLGRVLGPRGLMPNPKSGTVSNDPAAAVQEAKAGRVEFRTDKGGYTHTPIGKVSFAVEQLAENCNAVIQALLRARPASTKGAYLVKCSLTATMGPRVSLDTHEFVKG